MPSLRTAKRKRRRISAPRGRRLLLWSSQLRLGAETRATSALGRRGVTAAHALYTPIVAIAPQSVSRSSSSRSASAGGASSLPRTAPHLAADLARKRSTTVRWLRLNGTSVSVTRGGPKGCFRRRLRLRWRQLDGPPGGPRTPWSTGLKPAFLQKPLWIHHGSILLISLCMSGHSARMWAPSTNAEGKQRHEMHVATRRPGATNGSCIVGNPGSGPSPMASTEPRRVP